MSNDLQLSESIKLPPQNIESRTIGARFTDVGQRRCSKIADTLRSDDFYKGAHKIIYEAMLELYEAREPIDMLSLSNRLEEKNNLK